MDYTEGYPLLQSDLEPSYSTCRTVIPTTFDALLMCVFPSDQQTGNEPSQALKVLAQSSQTKDTVLTKSECLELFQPMTRADCALPSTGRLAPSFEDGMAQVTEDLAPYVRAIMAYDMRLEEYRTKLGGLLSRDNKRMRKTRASRAALEGGDKAFTRKERWLDAGSKVPQIMDTGKRDWQNELVRQGYFTVGAVGEVSEGDLM